MWSLSHRILSTRSPCRVNFSPCIIFAPFVVCPPTTTTFAGPFQLRALDDIIFVFCLSKLLLKTAHWQLLICCNWACLQSCPRLIRSPISIWTRQLHTQLLCFPLFPVRLLISVYNFNDPLSHLLHIPPCSVYNSMLCLVSQYKCTIPIQLTRRGGGLLMTKIRAGDSSGSPQCAAPPGSSQEPELTIDDIK